MGELEISAEHGVYDAISSTQITNTMEYMVQFLFHQSMLMLAVSQSLLGCMFTPYIYRMKHGNTCVMHNQIHIAKQSLQPKPMV